MEISLSQNIWFGNESVKITLPDNWEVQYHGIKGDETPALTKEQIRVKLNNPIGTKPLSELAKGVESVVIIFDDISRGTPTKIMAEVVVEELLAAGVPKKGIRFICALGTHGAHTRMEFAKKLGEDIVEEYPVFNHNCYENCVEVGKTSEGFPVSINAEVAACELKIGIGAITPHPLNGFGGGGKILFPGIASIETIEKNHSAAFEGLKASGLNPVLGMGNLENKGMREGIEEMAKMVPNFFKVDAIYNTKSEVVDLFAGDLVEEYYVGVERAKELYSTPRAKDKDVVIVNANAKANEAAIACFFGAMGVNFNGGDLVIVNHAQAGQLTHYLIGPFGKTVGGRMYSKIPLELPHVKRLIYFSPYPDYASMMFFGNPDKIIYAKTWDEVMNIIGDHGEGTKCSVLADGTIQYYK